MLKYMSQSEIVEILDDAGHVIGTMPRAQAEDSHHVMQNVLIYIFTPRDEVWIQLRPKTKKTLPGLWDASACGGLMHGETPIACAIRELEEETGFRTPLTHVESFIHEFTALDGAHFKKLSHLYIGVTDKQPHDTDEVDEFKTVPYKLLRAEVADHPDRFVPSFLFEFDKVIAAFEAGQHRLTGPAGARQ